jgi:hypothetical protein
LGETGSLHLIASGGNDFFDWLPAADFSELIEGGTGEGRFL